MRRGVVKTYLVNARKDSMRKITLKSMKNKLDTAFSKVIRMVEVCERCGKQENLQCSHIHSRKKLSVRWDVLNAFCLCAGCHIFWWHMHPIEAAEFTRQKLGEEKYLELLRRANKPVKFTIPQLQEILKSLEKILNSERESI